MTLTIILLTFLLVLGVYNLHIQASHNFYSRSHETHYHAKSLLKQTHNVGKRVDQIGYIHKFSNTPSLSPNPSKYSPRPPAPLQLHLLEAQGSTPNPTFIHTLLQQFPPYNQSLLSYYTPNQYPDYSNKNYEQYRLGDELQFGQYRGNRYGLYRLGEPSGIDSLESGADNGNTGASKNFGSVFLGVGDRRYVPGGRVMQVPVTGTTRTGQKVNGFTEISQSCPSGVPVSKDTEVLNNKIIPESAVGATTYVTQSSNAPNSAGELITYVNNIEADTINYNLPNPTFY